MDSTTSEVVSDKPKSFKLILGLLAVLIVFGLIAVSFKGKKQVSEPPQSTETNKLPAANIMNADFLPTTEAVQVGVDGSTEMIIKGIDPSKKISGIQLKFTATGPVKIKDITLSRTDRGAVTILKKEILGNQAGIAGVIIESADKLPSEIRAKINFLAEAPGTVTFNLDRTSVQVTGPIESNSYEISQTDALNFVIK